MINVILFIVSIVVFYIVIETAVKNGINKSRIGEYYQAGSLEEPEDTKESFFDDDLDNRD
ncbi:hypothetical protein [Sediminibacillus albus]|uniref:Tumour necrosis factor receptor superfamily member 19 n=1 Tax=Sediminibacillus albus TaxID=407036 RepID=A0A1G8Y6H7_9BACI|nr:hypothetical protein [Sediminibacillus albus]SDJ98412.1 hypothetical protein SAMN05216243_1435 [Sediminibacillus albus]